MLPATHVTVQQFNMKSKLSADTLSQYSLESATSLDSKDMPMYVAAGDIRRRLSENMAVPKKKFDVCGVGLSLAVMSSSSQLRIASTEFCHLSFCAPLFRYICRSL